MNVGTTPSLEPLTVGQILDRAFRLYRRRFLTFVGIIAVALVPLTLIQLVLNVVNIPDVLAATEQFDEALAYPSGGSGLREFLGLWSAASGGQYALVFSVLQIVLVQSFATAALARAVGDGYLGETTDISGAYRRVGTVWTRLLWAVLLGLLLTIGLALFAFVPCVGWLVGLGILIYYSLAIYPMLPPVLVLEGQTATGVFRRAWDLVRRRFWWVLGFMLLLSLFGQIIIGGPVFLLTFGLNMALQDMTIANPVAAMTIQTVIQSVMTLLLNLLYLPLQMTAITLMYFDLRVRTEGFDLALLAASAGGESSVEGTEVAAQAPRPERGNLVTGNEIIYFFSISAAVAIVCGLCYGAVYMLTAMTYPYPY